MLSRTADNLFWMCRHIERAENTARMLGVNLTMSLLPRSPQSLAQSWQAVLRISELQHAYADRYGDVDPRTIMQFMVRDADNPSSIYACIRACRENARAVRGSLTTEVWETCNTTWLEMLRLLAEGQLERNPDAFFDWIKFRAHLTRGVMAGTMLDDEALHFMRLGSHLERADNTARLLDVKFHEQPDNTSTGGHQAQDFYRWSAILAAVSGLEVYRKVYRDVISPERVAELLILRADMPSSLLACMRALSRDLQHVANQRSRETGRLAGKLRAELEYGRVEDILRAGLHRYLENFLARINDLGNRISRDFLVPLTT